MQAFESRTNCSVGQSLPTLTRLCHFGGRSLRYTPQRTTKNAVLAISNSRKCASIGKKGHTSMKSPCRRESLTSPRGCPSVLRRRQTPSAAHSTSKSAPPLWTLLGSHTKQMREFSPTLSPATVGFAATLLQFAVASSARADEVVDLQDERFVSTEYDPVVAIVFAFIVLCLLIVTAGVRPRKLSSKHRKVLKYIIDLSSL
jgi:hypothetical protein